MFLPKPRPRLEHSLNRFACGGTSSPGFSLLSAPQAAVLPQHRGPAGRGHREGRPDTPGRGGWLSQLFHRALCFPFVTMPGTQHRK